MLRAGIEPDRERVRVLGMRLSATAVLSAALLAAGTLVAVPAPAQSPTAPTIVIRDFGFTGDLTVRPGVTVKVVNDDAVAHTLTDKQTDKWDTGTIAPNGGTATFTAPATVGRYPFGCRIHPEMTGTLVVAVPTDRSALTAPRSRTIVRGTTTRLSGTLTDTATHTRLAHRTLHLLRRAGAHGAFHEVRTVRTNAHGVARTRVGPRSTSQYKWRFAGSSGHRRVTSGIGTVSVRSG
jgi:plastocyanin